MNLTLHDNSAIAVNSVGKALHCDVNDEIYFVDDAIELIKDDPTYTKSDFTPIVIIGW